VAVFVCLSYAMLSSAFPFCGGGVSLGRSAWAEWEEIALEMEAETETVVGTGILGRRGVSLFSGCV
jgi:hypothetical protein